MPEACCAAKEAAEGLPRFAPLVVVVDETIDVVLAAAALELLLAVAPEVELIMLLEAVAFAGGAKRPTSAAMADTAEALGIVPTAAVALAMESDNCVVDAVVIEATLGTVAVMVVGRSCCCNVGFGKLGNDGRGAGGSVVGTTVKATASDVDDVDG